METVCVPLFRALRARAAAASRRLRGVGILDVAIWATFGLVLALLWVPVLAHYYVPKPVIADELVNAARSVPPDSLLRELATIRFFDRNAEESVVAVADRLLQGVLEWTPGEGATRIAVPFDPSDLQREGPQLFLASFGVPRVFLDAYAVSGREEFLDAARSYVMAWARYEERAWLPAGLSWNDHAVAERVLVVAEFWRAYRGRGDYDEGVARTVVELAARHGVLLSRPSHFTVATNHGVMQNLALLHLCLAFPTLPTVDEYKRLAVERLGEQFEFYINDEGVVLEHSTGYHRFGLEFLSRAMRYLTLAGVAPPAAWAEKYRKARDVYGHWRLPDGRLPIFGDTKARLDSVGPLVASMDAEGRVSKLEHHRAWAPSEVVTIYPVAGYATWWDGLDRWPNEGDLAQTVVAWSHFPGHAHKHAEEMSLWVWAGGQAWWRNIGYWPYGHKQRGRATSWSGSNAPHLVGERTDASGRPALRYSASSGELAFIHLERVGPGGYVVGRQVLWKKPALWLVLDSAVGANGRTRTIWTTSPAVAVDEGPMVGSFTLRSESLVLEALFFGVPRATIRSLRGSTSPFAGWSADGARVEATSAIVVEQPAANAWAAATWSLRRATDSPKRASGSAPVIHADNDRNWKASFPAGSASLVVERAGDALSVVEDSAEGSRRDTLALLAPPDTADAYASIRRSHLTAVQKYPQFRDHYRHRLKLSWLLPIGFVVQESLLLYFRVRHPGRRWAVIRWATLGGWAVGGGLLTFYLPEVVDLYTRASELYLR